MRAHYRSLKKLVAFFTMPYAPGYGWKRICQLDAPPGYRKTAQRRRSKGFGGRRLRFVVRVTRSTVGRLPLMVGSWIIKKPQKASKGKKA